MAKNLPQGGVIFIGSSALFIRVASVGLMKHDRKRSTTATCTTILIISNIDYQQIVERKELAGECENRLLPENVTCASQMSC